MRELECCVVSGVSRACVGPDAAQSKHINCSCLLTAKQAQQLEGARGFQTMLMRMKLGVLTPPCSRQGRQEGERCKARG